MRLSQVLKFCVLLAIASFIIVLGLSNNGQTAMKSGVQCFKCHTMHNSQNGTSERGDSASERGITNPECNGCHADLRRGGLLKMDCIGCHAENPTSGSVNISSLGAPQIAHNTSPDLAAGNYRYVFTNNDSKGHNVHGFYPSIDREDNIIPFDMPPGYDAALDNGAGWSTSSPYDITQNNLFCAGSNGCHGNRSESIPLKSLQKAHHANDAVVQNGTAAEGSQGGTVGTSYRFLFGVRGGEDPDWENSTGAGDHNQYKGSTYSGRSAGVDTISELCAACHGEFHKSGVAGIGDASNPWVRHPTDVEMPDVDVPSVYRGLDTDTEYQFYAYNTIVPVAKTVIQQNPDENVSGAGNRIVMCLSCHRAHASNYSDSLRWAYNSSMTSPNGCYQCHRNK